MFHTLRLDEIIKILEGVPQGAPLIIDFESLKPEVLMNGACPYNLQVIYGRLNDTLSRLKDTHLVIFITSEAMTPNDPRHALLHDEMLNAEPAQIASDIKDIEEHLNKLNETYDEVILIGHDKNNLSDISEQLTADGDPLNITTYQLDNKTEPQISTIPTEDRNEAIIREAIIQSATE